MSAPARSLFGCLPVLLEGGGHFATRVRDEDGERWQLYPSHSDSRVVPILRATGLAGRTLQPGDRAAYQLPDGEWIGGRVMGFERPVTGGQVLAWLLVGDAADHRIDKPPAGSCLWLGGRPARI